MPLNWRPLPVAALLVGGAAGLIYFGADTGPRRDSDCNLPSIAQSVLDKNSPMDDELECRRQILMQRAAVKNRAVGSLLAGQLTLLQAAAQFRDVEQALPITWAPPIEATGPAESERLCRCVMAWAHRRVPKYPPAEAASVAARLEAELEQHRGADGTIRLPE
jgi:hypothetical protein